MNDPRLLSLTIKDAGEQILELIAFSEYRKSLSEKLEDQDSDDGQFKVRTDEEARNIADTPMLTGDPEFDAMELAETAETKPLLSEG
jgi:hypothetical protein